MSRLKKFQEILAQYGRHGWRLARLLARPETAEEFRAGAGAEGGAAAFGGVPVAESDVDAMW
ncbi:MAG TPA: hypothetical protein VF570_21650, partial [Pyrinomonadaceae bacterium]